MKSCPSCQQVYPDDGPDYCTKDGTALVRSPSEYNPGSAPGGQWQQPPTGWQPPPPGYGYPPMAANDPGSTGGVVRLATIAMSMGIIAATSLVLGFLLRASAASSYSSSGSYDAPNFGLLKFVSILFMLMFITGLTAINLGIVALSIAPNNSAGKAKSLIGLCLGALPFLLLIILVMGSGPWFGF